MMRLLNICVIVALVLAAADVYKIKFESTRQAQRVAKLRMEIRREHDAIAALRAEWAKLDGPGRIQELTQRHLPLRPLEGRQIDRLDNLPERPPPKRETRRQGLVDMLLYGRNVDRAVKTRARIGLAILVFTIGYAVIAARLVMFAAGPDSHGSRRAASSRRWRSRAC